MKSTAQSPAVPKEVEALRTSLESRLSALEKALADPKQHGSLESIILDLARMATEEAHSTARHAVLDVQKAGQQAVAAARTEAAAALEAEKVESANLRQVIENAKSALKQAETTLKEQRRSAEAASEDAAAARRELETTREELEHERSARADARRDLEAALSAAHSERARALALADQATQTRTQEDSEKSALAIDLEQHRAALETERAAAAGLRHARSALESTVESTRRDLDSTRAERDVGLRELDAMRRELDNLREESEARTEDLSRAQAAQEEALKAAQDAALSAEERLREVIRERDAAQGEGVELRRQLEAAEAAGREAAEINRELQAAHEARDAAEVLEAARTAETHAEPGPDVETIVDLTSETKDEERQLAFERTRALEQALREAERRAEAAELELARHRESMPRVHAPSGESAPVASRSPQPPPEQTEFRGPARGAKRVAFKTDISLQVDGNPGKLVDLSVSGAQVLTPSAINPNRLVTVTLPAADGPVTCKAKVMWSRLEPRGGQLWYRAGVQFTNVDQRALETFMSLHQS